MLSRRLGHVVVWLIQPNSTQIMGNPPGESIIKLYDGFNSEAQSHIILGAHICIQS